MRGAPRVRGTRLRVDYLRKAPTGVRGADAGRKGREGGGFGMLDVLFLIVGSLAGRRRALGWEF